MKLPWIWKGCWFVSQWVPKISLFNGCLLEVTISLSCSPKGLPHGLWKIIDLKVDKAILEFQRAILWKAAQWKFQWLSPSSYFAWFDKPSCLLVQHVQPAVLLAKALYRQALFLPDSASDISASRPFTMETDPFPIGSMYGNHGIYANMTGVYWWDPCHVTIYSSTMDPMGPMMPWMLRSVSWDAHLEGHHHRAPQVNHHRVRFRGLSGAEGMIMPWPCQSKTLVKSLWMDYINMYIYIYIYLFIFTFIYLYIIICIS